MEFPTSIRVLLAAAVACATSLGVATADDRPVKRPPPPARYVEECGSCHLAYPARMLGASSWRAVLAGLESHFGSDATVAPEALEEIRAYLIAGARSKETATGSGPLLRITETAWFRHEHPKPGARVWAHPDVKSPANCGACHREAEAGSYGERSLRVPKGEAK